MVLQEFPVSPQGLPGSFWEMYVEGEESWSKLLGPISLQNSWAQSEGTKAVESFLFKPSVRKRLRVHLL